MKTLLLAAGLAAFATAAVADEVIIQRQPDVVVAPSAGPTVVEPSGGVVIEDRAANPYAPRLERNTQSRERTPNTGAGTSTSRSANQG